MIRYEIRGLMRGDGKPTTITIDAANEDEAVRQAGAKGVVVEKVTPRFVDRLPSPAPVARPPLPPPPPTEAIDEVKLSWLEQFARACFLLLAVLCWFGVGIGTISSLDRRGAGIEALIDTVALNSGLLAAIGSTLCAQMILLRGTIRQAAASKR